MPFCIGLTGGIGSGKSSAAFFSALGAGVVDVDDFSHALTRSGGAAIAAIHSEFGAEAIAPDGSLDRARMRELVFADTEQNQGSNAFYIPLSAKHRGHRSCRRLSRMPFGSCRCCWSVVIRIATRYSVWP